MTSTLADILLLLQEFFFFFKVCTVIYASEGKRILYIKVLEHQRLNFLWQFPSFYLLIDTAPRRKQT